MATDRLAALRAQQGGSYSSNQSYGGGAAGGGGDYQSRRPNPYAQQEDSGRYEMSNYAPANNGYAAPTSGGATDMNSFYSEVSAVQDALGAYNRNVSRISDLHARALNNMDDQAVSRELESTIAETRKMSNDLKKKIKALQAKGGDSRDGQARRQQAALLKEKFQTAIQNYQQVEQKHRNAHKQRMERQYRIVKPDATQEEVRAVVNGDPGAGIFQQALMSTRMGESKAAYREVQERHEDIKKIEQTIAELAQLFNDMAILVEEQGETINAIEQTTMTVEKDTEQGLQHTEKAKDSARSARKKRWICCAIVTVILIIVAIVIGVQVAQGNIGGGGGGNSNTQTVVTTATAAAPAPSVTGGGPAPALRLRLG